MVDSKPWQWDKVIDDFWREPSEESYYFVNRWQKLGFEKILDLGCGVGRHSLLFAENGFEVEAYDLSDEGLKELSQAAASRGLRVNFRLGDMTRIPYKENEFDGIFAYHAIYHTDTAGIRSVFAGMHRVLRPGGEVLVTLNSKANPSYRNPKQTKIDEHTLIKQEGLEQGIPHFYADLDTIRELIASFTIIRLRQVEEIRESGSSVHFFIHLKK